MVLLASSKKILVLHKKLQTVWNHVEFSHLRSKYEFITYQYETRETFIKDLKESFNDIIAIATDWDAFVPIGGLDNELLEALPLSLKVIALPSVGYDHVNGRLLRTRNIVLCHNPGSSQNAVADIALHLTLSCFRFTSLFEHALRESGHTLDARRKCLLFDIESGDIDEKHIKDRDISGYPFGEYIGNNISIQGPSGRKACIIGFGFIGQEIGKRLTVLGMEIHYFKRNQLTEDQSSRLGYQAIYHSSVDSLFEIADVLVLAVPLTPDTKHIVNSTSISKMPKGVKIVNVGRGPLIDQKALIEGLKSKQVLSAGLDVYEQEPIVEKELLNRYDVTLLPHIGGSTMEVSDNTIIDAFKNIDFVLAGNGLAKVVN